MESRVCLSHVVAPLPSLEVVMPRAHDFSKVLVVISVYTWATISAVFADAEFEHITVDDGLSHNSVYSIVQDRAGFLWLGTEDGLDRYDGNEILVLRSRPGDRNSLTTNNFGKILEDRDGILWFGTWGGGLDRFDPDTRSFASFRHDPTDSSTLANDRIEFLFQDSRGLLWVATDGTGLARSEPGRLATAGSFDRLVHDPTDPESLINDEVKWISEDGDGRLWIGTDGGLSRFDPESDRFEHFTHDPNDPNSLSSNRVRAVLVSNSGEVFVGTRGGGLSRFDPRSNHWTRYQQDPLDPASLADDSVSALFEDSAGVLWIGTYRGGLIRFDLETEEMVNYAFDPRDPSSLTHNRVETIAEDRARNLWIGTRGGGLNKLDLKPRKVEFWSQADEALPNPSVHGLVVDPENNLWIGTDGGGLVRFDLIERRFDRIPITFGESQEYDSNRLWALRIADGGSLWIGTYAEGLARLDSRSPELAEVFRSAKDQSGGLPSDRINAIAISSEGAVWVGTPVGLAVTDGQHFRMIGEQGERRTSEDDFITALAADPDGGVWVGTRSGLELFDLDHGSLERFSQRGIGTSTVTSLLLDDRHGSRIWVGTDGSGLFSLDRTTYEVQQFSEDAGLASAVVQCILQDSDGVLWLSTNRGISRFDANDGSVSNYDSDDGLEGVGFNSGSCARAPNGEMFFGSASGLASVVPVRMVASQFLPPVVITAFEVLNGELTIDHGFDAQIPIELEYWQNTISFSYAGLDYTAPKKNSYRYWLEGVDQDWVEAGNRQAAVYSNLDPGLYRFRVKAANPDGVWNPREAILLLEIEPPFWATTWFRLVSAVTLIGLLFGAHRFRVARIRSRAKQLQNVNLRLHQEISEKILAQTDRESLIKELEAKNAELERFAYTVSHDLKSPLVTIKGFLGLLAADTAAGNFERMAEDRKHIETAAEKMSRLLDELLELSRIGRVRRADLPVDLGEVADEVIDLLAGRIVEGQVEVEVVGALPVILGDRARLAEVFQNLIDNAIKFSHQAEKPRVEIDCAVNSVGEHVVSVIDNGIGIDPNYREKIFELFERLDTGTEGTGIGLALVKRIVESHGGRVWVESEGDGKGSTFCFTVEPMVSSKDDEAPEAQNS